VTQTGQRLGVEGATLKVKTLPGFMIQPGQEDWYWDVWRFADTALEDQGRYGGDFAHAVLPPTWYYTWEDVIDDEPEGSPDRVDTLRIHVPEPATLAILALGALGLIRRRRA
jgi:hypothetical protein